MRFIVTTASAVAALAATLALGPVAVATPADEVQWFSGQPSPAGDPFVVPQTLRSATAWSGGADMSADWGAPVWLGGSLNLGSLDRRAIAADPDLLFGDPSSSSIMATGYIAGQVWGLTPYVGAGLGAAPQAGTLPYGVQADQNSLTWAIAYQGVAGFSYSITPWMSTGFEYRYFATIDDLAAVPGARANDPYQSHDLMLRLELGF